MTRPDLGQEFDGWQTSDPTPQEKSEGEKNNKEKLKRFVTSPNKGWGKRGVAID